MPRLYARGGRRESPRQDAVETADLALAPVDDEPAGLAAAGLLDPPVEPSDPLPPAVPPESPGVLAGRLLEEPERESVR